MQITDFLRLHLPEHTDVVDVTVLTESLRVLEDLHRDSVKFYNSSIEGNVITLTTNGGRYPTEYVNNQSIIWSSPMDMKKGQKNIKIKIGNLAEVDIEILNNIKSGDFVFSKYYLSSSKFRVTSYYEEVKQLWAAVNDIKNGYDFTGNVYARTTSATEMQVGISRDDIDRRTYIYGATGGTGVYTLAPKANVSKNLIAYTYANNSLAYTDFESFKVGGYSGQTVLHTGNTGHGKKMDADMLDGRHASEFYLKTDKVANATNADKATNADNAKNADKAKDADTVDGKHAGYFLAKESYTAEDIRKKLGTVDGHDSGIDADVLDGRHASEFYLKTDKVANSVNSDKLGGHPTSYFATKADLASTMPYAVGDYYITSNAENPATRWAGTTWQKIEGRVLMASSSTYKLGTTGGSSSVKLSASHIPSHTHSFSGKTNLTGGHDHTSGKHRHKVDNHAHSQPAHTHNYNEGYYGGSGRIDWHDHTHNIVYRSKATSAAGAEATGGSAPYTDYQNPKTSSSGNHEHTLSGTTGATGSGKAFNIINPYLAVNIWRRTS